MNPQASYGPIASSLIGWSEHGHGNLSQRLAHALRVRIEAGLLATGTRLPPERRLAVDLAVSRSTVTAALDELRADGLVTSRQGQGTVVTGPTHAELATNRMADHLIAGAGGIDLAVGNPNDVSHLPPVSVDIADLLASGAGSGFHPLGLPALRQAIAAGYVELDIHTTADEIHVTAGAHQAIALLIGASTSPGDTVAAEVPGYPGLFDITDGAGLRLAPLALDRGGIRPESLEQVLAERRPRLVYVQAGVHNPTGVVAGPARLRALAAVFDRHDTLVVEDSTLAELAFAGRPTTDLSRLCRRTPVVSVGSFSKVLWAGLRIGWIRAPQTVVERTLHRHLAGDLGASVPSQVFCLRLLPQFPAIAARRRAYLRTNVRRAAELVAEELPAWDFEPPAGASVLWIDTGLDDAGPLVQVAHRHGVHVASGAITQPANTADGHLRLCVDRPWEVVEVGIRRLGAAWRELTARPARAAG